VDRRSFLRGAAGSSLLLPFAARLGRAEAQPPKRLVFLFVPNGKHMQTWTPAQEGRDVELAGTLAPLQGLRERVLVLSGLAIDGGRAHGDGPGDHARAGGSFLTCTHPKKTAGSDLQVGVSVDQVAAEQLGGQTRLPSLELGIERGRQAGSCDSGYACAYSSNISWRGPATPNAKETDPAAAFTRVFGDSVNPERAKQRLAARRSVLDLARAEAKELRRALGGGDRAKLDEYLESIRELEFKLSRPPVQVDAKPPQGKLDRPERLRAMLELTALALASDQTRVVTLMLANAGSNARYGFLDVPEGHHNLSHHKGDAHKHAQIRKIDRYHVGELAWFLQRLGELEQPDGSSLLEHTAVIYGSGLGDGNRHNHDHLPILLAGGPVAGRHGHLRFERETPLANLYVSALRWAGCRAHRFGDSTGALALG